MVPQRWSGMAACMGTLLLLLLLMVAVAAGEQKQIDGAAHAADASLPLVLAASTDIDAHRDESSSFALGMDMDMDMDIEDAADVDALLLELDAPTGTAPKKAKAPAQAKGPKAKGPAKSSKAKASKAKAPKAAKAVKAAKATKAVKAAKATKAVKTPKTAAQAKSKAKAPAKAKTTKAKAKTTKAKTKAQTPAKAKATKSTAKQTKAKKTKKTSAGSQTKKTAQTAKAGKKTSQAAKKKTTKAGKTSKSGAKKAAKATKAGKAGKTAAKSSKKSTKAAKKKTTKAAKTAKAGKTSKAAKASKATKASKASKTGKAGKATKAAKASKTKDAGKAAKSSSKADKQSADTKASAGKKMNPKLSAAENQTKYNRYKRLHPRRVRNAQTELAVFSANRARIVALNAKLGTGKRPTPFRSVGPFANMSPRDFKKKFLNSKHPRNRRNKKALPAPATKAVKGGKAPVKKAKTTQAKASKATTAGAKVASLKKRVTAKKSFLELHADEEYLALVEAATESGVDSESLALAEAHARAFAEAWEQAEFGDWVQLESSAEAEGAPTTTRSSGAGKAVGNGKNAGKGGTRGGNGKDVGKGGTRGGNGNDVGKGGTRGGNGNGAGKGGTRGGNGSDAGKGGTRGGNGSDAGKGGTRGGNGEDAGKGGTRGGNGDDAGKGGTRGGEDYLPVNQGDGVEPLPAGFVPRPTTRAQVLASLTKAGASQAQLDWVLKNTKELGVIRSAKVVDQGTCGSCWAQTASNTIAMQRARYFQGLSRATPSVQQLLDCVQTKESGGCAGGTPMDALDWMASNRLATTVDYPMRADGASGSCRIPAGGVDDQFRSWGWQPAVPVCADSNPNCVGQQLQEVALLDQLMQSVSIPIAYVDATNWQMYDGGLFDTQLCSSTLEAGNHVVELTGIGTDPHTGAPYWLLRNSWGEQWGEKGLIRVPFGVNACGLANWVVVPKPPPFVLERTPEQQNPTSPGARRDASIIVSPDASGIRYNSQNGMWFDPQKGGWTSDRPAAAPASMGPAASAEAMISDAMRTVPTAAEAAAIKAGCKKDGSMWFDPDIGGWASKRPAQCPASLQTLKH